MPGPTVRFLGWQSDDVIRDHYRRATALLFPAEEDFGIVPVEAQACGRPVVALARGGALESVIPGDTGVLFTEPTVESLVTALEQVSAITFDPARIRDRALQFSRSRHLERMREVIDETLDAPAGTRW